MMRLLIPETFAPNSVSPPIREIRPGMQGHNGGRAARSTPRVEIDRILNRNHGILQDFRGLDGVGQDLLGHRRVPLAPEQEL